MPASEAVPHKVLFMTSAFPTNLLLPHIQWDRQRPQNFNKSQSSGHASTAEKKQQNRGVLASLPLPSANWASDSGPFCELIKFLAFQRGPVPRGGRVVGAAGACDLFRGRAQKYKIGSRRLLLRFPLPPPSASNEKVCLNTLLLVASAALSISAFSP